MLAVQYRVYRISAWKKDKYLEKLKSCRPYDNGHMTVLENNPPAISGYGNIPTSCSVRNLSLIPEKRLFDFLRIVGVDNATIEKAKELVEIRGTYAHANGRIEENIEARIDEYLETLKAIQEYMSPVNIGAQDWANEIEEEYPLEDFFSERFLQSQFSPRDFSDIIGNLLKAQQLDFNQWEQVAYKGLELAYEQTIFELKYIETMESFDKNKKSKVTSILQEIGESSVLSLQEAQDLRLV